jgi:hypothetical protein
MNAYYMKDLSKYTWYLHILNAMVIFLAYAKQRLCFYTVVNDCDSYKDFSSLQTALAMDAFEVFPRSVVIIFLLSIIKQIHLQMVGLVTCTSAACSNTSFEVLSKVLSILRKAAKAVPLCSVACWL